MALPAIAWPLQMKPIPVRHIAQSFRGQDNSSGEHDNIGRFSIRDIHSILAGKDLIHDHHKHDFYFVLALDKGQGLHEIDLTSYPVQDHSVFILRPGQVHKLELKAGSTGFLMEFDLMFYQPKKTITDQRWRKASGRNYCQIEDARYERIQAVLSNILHEFTQKHEGYIEAIRANLDIFFIEYIRQSDNRKTITKAESSYNQDRFEEFMQLLETHISSIRNVSGYASLLHLSSYQLNAITKAAVDKTVSELINDQVILEAKRYLLTTSGQVKDVADHLGYEDVSYFIRFFKKHTGYSPESFRQQSK